MLDIDELLTMWAEKLLSPGLSALLSPSLTLSFLSENIDVVRVTSNGRYLSRARKGRGKGKRRDSPSLVTSISWYLSLDRERRVSAK